MTCTVSVRPSRRTRVSRHRPLAVAMAARSVGVPNLLQRVRGSGPSVQSVVAAARAAPRSPSTGWSRRSGRRGCAGVPRRRRHHRPHARCGRGSGRQSTRPAGGHTRSSRCAGVATAAPAPADTPGETETTAAPRCRPRPSSCRTRSVSWALRRPVVMPRHPEYLLTGTLEQRVVFYCDGQTRSSGEQSGHDQIGQGQSHRVTRPAGIGEQSVRAAVMPHPIQPGAGEHSTHRSAPSLRDQANHQPKESMECWSGKARPEHGKQTGQRAR